MTGIVVNTRTSVPRAEEDRLRAVLYDAQGRGPEAANRSGVPHFRSHLEGRVGWFEAVSPVRGGRLIRQLNAVVWPRG